MSFFHGQQRSLATGEGTPHNLEDLAFLNFTNTKSPVHVAQEFGFATVIGVLKAATLEQNQQRNIGSKVALLVANDLTYGLARIYATIAGEYKEAINIFYSMEEAIDWLNLGEDQAEVKNYINSLL